MIQTNPKHDLENFCLMKTNEFSKDVQIFLSYARADEEAVKSIYHGLRDAGFQPWMDIMAHIPGEPWRSSIRRALVESQVLLVFISGNSINRRGEIQKEIQSAFDFWNEKSNSESFLLTVLLEDSDIPDILKDAQRIVLFKRDGWDELTAALTEGVKRLDLNAFPEYLGRNLDMPEIQRETQQTLGDVITFYSYKGGVGRTMALANMAVLLSEWDYKVLVVDWDLEAPGLEYFYQDYIDLEYVESKEGVVDLLLNASGFSNEKEERVHWKEHLIEIKLPYGRQPLHFLTAGKRGENYFDNVRSLDLKEFYKKNGGVYIERLRREWKEEYDYVLIDSRTGVTDLGGVCTLQLPDILILLFTATDQNLKGILDIAPKSRNARKKLPFDRLSLRTVPIPSRFDSAEEFKISQAWLDRFSKKLKRLYSNWLPRTVQRREFLELSKIPYISYFSFGEKLPVVEQGATDPTGLGYAYETLAALLANKLENIDELMEARNNFLRSAVKNGRPLVKEIFISYAWGGESQKIADELYQVFQKKGAIVQDQQHLSFGERIMDFIKRMSTGKCVIVVISEKYLKSENCMYELIQIAKNGQFTDRVFPIVLKDAKIYRPIDLIYYVKYWEEKVVKLEAAMKGLPTESLKEFRDNIDLYKKIRNSIANLIDLIKDMNTLGIETHRNSDFKELVKAIMHKIGE